MWPAVFTTHSHDWHLFSLGCEVSSLRTWHPSHIHDLLEGAWELSCGPFLSDSCTLLANSSLRLELNVNLEKRSVCPLLGAFLKLPTP